LRGFACCLFPDSLLLLPPFFCLLLLHFFLFYFSILSRLLAHFFSFSFTPARLKPLPFAYLCLTSLSSTPHYEVQLTISSPKIIFILLHLCTSPKIYMAIELFVCLKCVPAAIHAARKHTSHAFITSSLVNIKRDALFFVPVTSSSRECLRESVFV